MGGTRDKSVPTHSSAARDDLDAGSTPSLFSLTTLYKLLVNPVYGEDCGICGRKQPRAQDERSKHPTRRHHQPNPLPWEAQRSRPGQR